MQSMWMLVASFLFALMAACAKGLGSDLGALSIVFWRGVFGVLFLYIWIVMTGKSIRTNHLKGHMRRSIVGTVAMSMWIFAVTKLPLSTGMTLNYTSPLFTAAIVIGIAAFRRERIDWPLVLATIAGFAGVLLVLRPDNIGGEVFAAAMGLGSGLLSAWAYMEVKALGKTGEPSWRIVFYFSIVNAVFGLLGHLLLEGEDTYTMNTIMLVAAVGFFATLAQVALTQSFGSGNLLLSSILSFSGIIFAAAIGFVLFSDRITLQSWLGITIIIVAGVSATVITKRNEQRAKAGNAIPVDKNKVSN